MSDIKNKDMGTLDLDESIFVCSTVVPRLTHKILPQKSDCKLNWMRTESDFLLRSTLNLTVDLILVQLGLRSEL